MQRRGSGQERLRVDWSPPVFPLTRYKAEIRRPPEGVRAAPWGDRQACRRGFLAPGAALR